MRIAAELVGAELQRDLSGAAPDEVDRCLPAHSGPEQVKVVERALVRDGEAVAARARVLEAGAVRALEGDARPRAHGPLESPRGGGRGEGERGDEHEAEKNGAACHLVPQRPSATNGFLPS